VSSKKINIGLFDSGIGGFSILNELFLVFPQAQYFYYSDDAFAPYGPKTDQEITKRTILITDELLKKNVDLIVVACNTATASSIDELRGKFPALPFVGVEPYLNVYYKMPEGPKKVMVLTTESTGKSERFKRLKSRLDPESKIDHFALKNLARYIEIFYHHGKDKKTLEQEVKEELAFLQNKKYTHVILGCTHYPLVANLIEQNLQLKTISPCPYIATRVLELMKDEIKNTNDTSIDLEFSFYSSNNNQWEKRKRSDILLPFSQ
jgi:glutamate racemase